MALDTNELFESATRSDFPRIAPDRDGGIFTRQFDGVAAAPKYKVGTPVYLDAGENNKAKVWTNGQTIDGFVYPNEVQTDAVNEVLGEVMQRGKIHYGDIVLPTGETEANLKTALRNKLVARGLLIQGLDQAA